MSSLSEDGVNSQRENNSAIRILLGKPCTCGVPRLSVLIVFDACRV